MGYVCVPYSLTTVNERWRRNGCWLYLANACVSSSEGAKQVLSFRRWPIASDETHVQVWRADFQWELSGEFVSSVSDTGGAGTFILGKLAYRQSSQRETVH